MGLAGCGRDANPRWSEWADGCEGHVAIESVTIEPEHAREFCQDAAHTGIDRGFEDPSDMSEQEAYEVFKATYEKCSPGFWGSLLSSRPDYCAS